MKRILAAHQSLLTALAIAAAITLWLLSGIAGGPAPATVADPQPATGPEPFSVRVRTLAAQSVSRDVVIYGRTEPARSVTLRAEIEARVIALGAERGASVGAGERIATLDPRDLAARLEQARATVRQRELEHEAAQRLESRQFQSQTALAAAAANLAAAKARVREVEVAIANTTIAAPFDGVLERREVEVGDYLSKGDAVARVIDVDPLVVTGHVTQHELGAIRAGSEGTASLVTGETVRGRVRYVSSESDQSTRTFRVELEVPNPDAALVAGVTAEIRIPTPPARAHLISPALLALDARERIGVKTVDEDGRVVFRPVSILDSDASGVWVTGLPDTVRVITVGQGFVRDGDRVTAVEDAPGAGAATPGGERAG